MKPIAIIILFAAWLMASCSGSHIEEADVTIIEGELKNDTLSEGILRREIDLTKVFALASTVIGHEGPDYKIRKSIELNSNTALVTAVIADDSLLILTIAIGQTGSADLRIRTRVQELDIEELHDFNLTVIPVAVNIAMTNAVQSFQDGDYQAAENYFRVSITKNSGPYQYDAYMGLGFALMRQQKADEDYGYIAFQTAKALNSTNVDAKAGLSLLEYSIKKNYAEAIGLADEVLTEQSNYVFKYDAQLDKNDMRVTKALSQFSLSQFDGCLATIKILDPAFNPDTNAADFQTQLLTKLDQLIQTYK